MKFFKNIALFAVALVCVCSCLSKYCIVNSDEVITYTVEFLDFDGEIMHTITVEEGGAIDYTLIDTSSLNNHIDDYTQIRFYAWDKTPETITEDTTIKALYQKAVLSIESEPVRREYFANSGNISIDGLNVSITMITQTVSGDSIIDNIEELDITDGCTIQPATLDEAFNQENVATISVFPPYTDSIQSRPLITYEIYLTELGDTDDSSTVDPVDATNALIHYSYISMNSDGTLSDEQANAADIDRNGAVDVVDATQILKYYSYKSFDDTLNWEQFLFPENT